MSTKDKRSLVIAAAIVAFAVYRARLGKTADVWASSAVVGIR